MSKNNKIVIIIFIIVSVLYMIFNLFTQVSDKEKFIGKPMPGIEIKDTLTEEILTSEKLKGKVLFVNFWATWCQPCITEMPSINQLYARLKNEKDFKMITIIFKENKTTSLNYLKNNNYGFPVFTDPSGKSAINFEVKRVPETYIINKKGIVTRVHQGTMDWASPQIVDELLNLIKQ